MQERMAAHTANNPLVQTISKPREPFMMSIHALTGLTSILYPEDRHSNTESHNSESFR